VTDRIGHLENEVLEDLPVCVGPACREDIILVRWPSELFLVPGEALLPWSFSLRSNHGVLGTLFSNNGHIHSVRVVRHQRVAFYCGLHAQGGQFWKTGLMCY
jgi:hypothetical protein